MPANVPKASTIIIGRIAINAIIVALMWVTPKRFNISKVKATIAKYPRLKLILINPTCNS